MAAPEAPRAARSPAGCLLHLLGIGSRPASGKAGACLLCIPRGAPLVSPSCSHAPPLPCARARSVCLPTACSKPRPLPFPSFPPAFPCPTGENYLGLATPRANLLSPMYTLTPAPTPHPPLPARRASGWAPSLPRCWCPACSSCSCWTGRGATSSASTCRPRCCFEFGFVVWG